MATAHCTHPIKFQYRCRRCRHTLMYDDAAAEVGLGCSACTDGEQLSQVWYFQEGSVPPWIQYSIEESSWTRGKLLCPKCQGRLGSFDFTMQPRCGQGLHMLPCVHLVKSRVDRTVASPPVARVRPFQQEEGLWSSPAQSETCPTPSPASQSPKSSTGPWNSHTDAGLSCPKSNSHLRAPKCSVAPNDHITLNCCCGRSDGSSFDAHVNAFPTTPEKSNCQNLPRTCSLGCGQSISPLDQKNQDVQEPFQPPLVPPGYSSGGGVHVGRVQCCQCPCLPDTRLHSEDDTKFARLSSALADNARLHPNACHCKENFECNETRNRHQNDYQNLAPVPSETAFPRGAGRRSEVGCHCKEGNFECNEAHREQNDYQDHALAPETGLLRGVSRRSEGGSSPEDEAPPCMGQPEDSAGDLLHDWEILEELEELNSSLLSYQRKAEVRREKNRRKRIRRKLRKNSHQQLLDGDLKGLPPSKFEEMTGISLGDKSIQEFTICAVCLDLFFNPRACSPCGHLFCEQCLRQLTRFNPTSTPCPLCRTVIQATIPHEGLSKALSELFPSQMRQRQEAYQRMKQLFPLPRTQNIPSIWLPLFSQQILSGRNRRQMFWTLQPNSSLDYHDFGRLWVQTLRWRFTMAGYGLLALLLVCACSVLVINFV